MKYWITLNEPWVIAWLGYGVGAKAPGKKEEAQMPYTSGHNLIKAHTKAYHVYDREFRSRQKGAHKIPHLEPQWCLVLLHMKVNIKENIPKSVLSLSYLIYVVLIFVISRFVISITLSK